MGASQRRQASAHERTAGRSGPLPSALLAMIQAGRHHGVELDPEEFPRTPNEAAPSAASLSLWAQNAGVWARAVRLNWGHLLRFQDSAPVVLLFKDGSAGLLTGANPDQNVVFIANPSAPVGSASRAVDELRLSQVWAGDAVLLRAARSVVSTDAPFNLRWIGGLVMHERQSLRDIAVASLTLSVLTIFPPLLVMATVNKVLQFHSVSTLVLLSTVMVIIVAYETMLGYARRLIMSVIGA